MSEGICVPTQGAWSLVRGNPESHIPMYNRHPLAQREIGVQFPRKIETNAHATSWRAMLTFATS